jgi:cytochrome c peroxidase
MGSKWIISSLFITAMIAVVSCKKEPEPSAQPPADTVTTLTPYNIIYPAHFPIPSIPEDNKPYKERIELGRRLYYDPSLSNDGRSCSGCHLQSYGFTKPGIANEMPVLPHVNMAWHTNFMWNGSKKGTLEDVMLFETKDFFGTDLEKINSNAEYKSLFKKYFGVSYITHKEIAYALAQFTRTLISGNTKYDRFVKGTEQLTLQEQRGWQIFFSEKGDCFHCHTILITTDNQFHNTGMDSIYTKTADKGYYNVTGNIADLGKFRTPNLRNVALRSHFMHDGRYATLEEVIDFYDHGVKRVSNLDPIMTKPGKENGLQLTSEEKEQLVAFLHTLTDSTFLQNSAYAHP